MKPLTQIVKTVFLTLFVLSITEVLFAEDFVLTFRTSQDTSLADSRFMQVGWAAQERYIPAPPKPPGASFYMLIDGNKFKSIKTFEANTVYEWEFQFNLQNEVEPKQFFFDSTYIRAHTDFAIIVDEESNIYADLRNLTTVSLSTSLNGHFKVIIIPKGSVIKPHAMEIGDEKVYKQQLAYESLIIDLHELFVFNVNQEIKFTAEVLDGESIQVNMLNEYEMEIIPASTPEARLRIKAKNGLGSSEVDITVKFNIITDVHEALPKDQFSLDQNYPNPFNPSTTISYTLNEPTKVRMDVFNMQGQKVATLVNENKFTGTHQVQFDATGLPSGLYIYRITTAKQTQSRKMTLLK